jgi:hypothetical protein
LIADRRSTQGNRFATDDEAASKKKRPFPLPGRRVGGTSLAPSYEITKEQQRMGATDEAVNFDS